MARTSTLQLSLTDIARLAEVRRPVVSMWRNRPVAGHPFPQPVTNDGGTERFDAFEIVDYLAATGRGNSTVAREDVAAHATLALPTQLPDNVVFDGLTALLTLGVVSGEPLSDLTAGGIVDLATTHDHDDVLLLREIVTLAPELETFAAHADTLADASWSPAAAFELLLDQRRPKGPCRPVRGRAAARGHRPRGPSRGRARRRSRMADAALRRRQRQRRRPPARHVQEVCRWACSQRRLGLRSTPLSHASRGDACGCTTCTASTSTGTCTSTRATSTSEMSPGTGRSTCCTCPTRRTRR